MKYKLTHSHSLSFHAITINIYTAGGSGDEVYGFGSGKRGQLGISKDKIKSISLPERIYGFEGVTITSIIASGDQSAALSGEYSKLPSCGMCIFICSFKMIHFL